MLATAFRAARVMPHLELVASSGHFARSEELCDSRDR